MITMHWMNKLERKLGRYAVKNLIVYVLGAYGIGYVLYFMERFNLLPGCYSLMEMNPQLIFQGQVWRLVTWVVTIPQNPNLFLIFMFLLYFWIGQTLERIWGTFRYNVFIFMGLILMTVGPILIYLITGLIHGFDNGVNLTSSTYYLNLTSFLAFATIFPDQQVYFMGILPIKMKWLAILDAGLLAWTITQNALLVISAPVYAALGISNIVSILLSVANFVVYFLSTRNYKKLSPVEIKRKRKYRKQVKAVRSQVSRHRCAVCGRTEESNPELSFRFCSKCKGNLEYCSDHLFTHEHKQ